MSAMRKVFKKPVKIEDNRRNRKDCNNSRFETIVSSLNKYGEKDFEDISLSCNIEDNQKRIQEVFKDCSDFVVRRFDVGDGKIKCFISYIESMAGKEDIEDNVLKALMTDSRIIDVSRESEQDNLLKVFSRILISDSEVSELFKLKDIVDKALNGHCILFVDGNSGVLAVDTKKIKARNVGVANIEPVIRGPQEAFVEDIVTNISLLRKRIKTPNLKTEKFEIGRLSKTEVVIAYIKGLAEDSLVRELRKRIKRIDIDVIVDSSYIEALISDEVYSPFPNMQVTERPDVCMGNLAEGRVLVLVDGSPFVLIVPGLFSDFFSASEDYYYNFYFATLLRVLRYLSFFTALLAPATYIAVTTFHQEMIPTPLLITIATARSEVPFPAIVEALLMELTFEILREAGVRLPQPIGPAISIVGGLVIGQGVVQAGIASQIMVIVVAITGIASFSLPRFNAAAAVRVLRFPMMILAATLGIYGIVIGLILLLIHLTSLRSFGVQFLSGYSTLTLEGWKDSVIKSPLWYLHKRPAYIQKNNLTRIRKGLKPRPPAKK